MEIMESVIKNGIKYIAVCKSVDVFEGKGKQILFEGDDDFQIAIFRVNNRIYALENICPHRHADRIFDGIIDELTVMCPLHGWTYSLETGQNINQLQGIKSLIKYEAYEENGYIYLEEPKFEIPKWRR
jgi:nitrite reductase/ring-hydroxylating ferredoxin subunit